MAAPQLKVLFFGEGATLAHVARPYVLARSLDRARFDVAFARPPAFAWLTDGDGFRTADLACQDAPIFASRLERGLPLYDYPTLAKYVEDDLALIDTEQPDLILGDFRLSLSVSARLRTVPYVTICDAYWSPECPLRTPLPVLSFTRFTPIALARLVFQCAAPFAMRLHTLPLERLRARHGLSSLGHDLRRCYTDADLRLFANFPALFPDVEPSRNAAFVGPISWSPSPTEPIDLAGGHRPLAYVTMGSSGKTDVLATIASVLEARDCDIVVSTAGKRLSRDIRSASTRVFDYLPGDLACGAASLVICNGGSPTTNQALSHGVPVIGIAWNMDQFLNMRAIEAFGAGIVVRGDRASKARLMHAVKALTSDPSYAHRARVLARSIRVEDCGTRLTTSLDRLLSHSRSPN